MNSTLMQQHIEILTVIVYKLNSSIANHMGIMYLCSNNNIEQCYVSDVKINHGCNLVGRWRFSGVNRKLCVNVLPTVSILALMKDFSVKLLIEVNVNISNEHKFSDVY